MNLPGGQSTQYPVLAPPVQALFTALGSKVGAYALLRVLNVTAE